MDNCTLAAVYKNDQIVKEQNMDADKRLRFHQDKCGPLMEELNTWFHQQLDQYLVEPNTSHGIDAQTLGGVSPPEAQNHFFTFLS